MVNLQRGSKSPIALKCHKADGRFIAYCTGEVLSQKGVIHSDSLITVNGNPRGKTEGHVCILMGIKKRFMQIDSTVTKTKTSTQSESVCWPPREACKYIEGLV